jgi:lysyl-tRNA synthetase, class I
MSSLPAETAFPSELIEAARVSPAWPFEEARKLVKRIQATGQKHVLFETGYGPSGLPHIGTFGEVARTSMARHAFEVLTEGAISTKLIAFSDDMDGLRKVPDNIPNKELVAQHLGKPLTKVPDPFGTHESFGAHNNARLRAFLDAFGFGYEFASSTHYYRTGRFDEALTGRNVDAGTIDWRDPASGESFTTPVTGGHCKLQWKPDWAMRWFALGVDYEMAGKDLIESVKVSSAIVRALGGKPPEGFNYELFLDAEGQKISKSKGNGLTIEEWLTYASPESLAQFMYQRPTAAKRLHFDVIPRNVDDYLAFLDAYPRQAWKERLGNPVWHIHSGSPPEPEVLHHPGETNAKGTTVSFAMLLNLATVANAEDPSVLWGFLRRYAPQASPENHPRLDKLLGYAVAYFRDFVRPKKRYRPADETEREVLQKLSDALAALPEGADGEAIQTALYDLARAVPRYQDFGAKGATPERPGVSNDFFNMLYAVLLGEEKGPRFGSFAALYGVQETRALIARALAGGLSGAA